MGPADVKPGEQGAEGSFFTGAVMSSPLQQQWSSLKYPEPSEATFRETYTHLQ